MTPVNYLSAVCKYMPPCCRATYVWHVKQSRRSTYSNVQACNNRLVLLESKHMLYIQQRTALASVTIGCRTTWRSVIIILSVYQYGTSAYPIQSNRTHGRTQPMPSWSVYYSSCTSRLYYAFYTRVAMRSSEWSTSRQSKRSTVKVAWPHRVLAGMNSWPHDDH